MKRPLSLSTCTLAVLLLAAAARAETETQNTAVECFKSAAFLAPLDPTDQRQYAPDRAVQVLHLALDVTPDFKERTIQAVATLRLKAIAKPVQEVKFDALDLDIHSLQASVKVQAWQFADEKVIVTFAEPILPDKEVSVSFSYSAEPTEGLYFRTPEMGYMEGDTHLFSQGEEIEARHWYPCLDSPNQRLTSEVTCRVPQGMTVISNGRLVSEDKDPATGLAIFHWVQEKSQANYLVSLVAGYFKKIEDTCHGLPLAFYTPASEINEAASSFRDTKDMITFFEQEIGVPYPWDKYYQVCVNDFVAGGMENTSATTLTDRTLFTSATENIRNSDGLVAHELAHQWFGDFVTCKDWSHIWLNEGFATYYETLYGAHKHGRDFMLYELYGRARTITGMTNDFNPIVRRNYGEPREMFGYLVYPKAGWVLHMLRSQLGESLYRECIKTYLQRHQLGNVVTEDLRAVIEELSGRSYDRFFDQWLYHGHFPELEVAYTWDEAAKLARASVQQVQDINANVLLFQFPLVIRFKGKDATIDRTIQVTKKQEDFYFPLASAPELVRVDPEYTLLAKIKFTLPAPMLYAQLADQHDVVGRLLAIEQLSPKKDKQSLAKLKQTLNEDSFYGVRIEAAKAVRAIHTDEALDALLGSRKQSDARVRREVVDDIGGFYDDKALAASQQVLGQEKNPDILSAALGELGGYAKPGVGDTLLKFLNSDSYRNELAEAAISGLRSQDDPAAIAPLTEALSKREGEFTSRGFSQGLQTLAYLARNEEKKDQVLEFLVARVNHKKKSVQLADLRALDTLGDPRAIAVLEKFATASKASPERAAAERAVADLRALRKPVDDFKNLRQEVLDLEKANRDLRKELDDLKKKFDAAAGRPSVRGRASVPGSPTNPPSVLISPKSSSGEK
ncbi:MAG TPA: M1 family aminopeptidase [Candidatus Acidoferrum sp.]|nr:M1 family aminopeptidase [Candidatus Acidoferrum sp.]